MKYVNKGHVPINHKTVLAFLRQHGKKNGPASVITIGICLDPICGCFYPTSHVMRVLRGLQKKELIKRIPDGWIITDKGINTIESK